MIPPPLNSPPPRLSEGNKFGVGSEFCHGGRRRNDNGHYFPGAQGEWVLPAEERRRRARHCGPGRSLCGLCLHSRRCPFRLPGSAANTAPHPAPRDPAVLHQVREQGLVQREEAGGEEGWSPARLGDKLGCPGLARGGGMRRWLIGESPVAIVCSCTLWGRAAEGDKASGQLGL